MCDGGERLQEWVSKNPTALLNEDVSPDVAPQRDNQQGVGDQTNQVYPHKPPNLGVL